MSGKLLQKTISDSSEISLSNWLSLLLIFSAGALAIWCHESLRWPLNMAGRHGLELMAIFTFVRLNSHLHSATLIAALGGATASAFFHDGLGINVLILFTQAAFIDMCFYFIKRTFLPLILITLVAAFAHVLKPILKLGFQSGMGIFSDSLHFGLFYPTMSHFMFGFIGAMAGYLAWRSMKNSHNNRIRI